VIPAEGQNSEPAKTKSEIHLVRISVHPVSKAQKDIPAFGSRKLLKIFKILVRPSCPIGFFLHSLVTFWGQFVFRKTYSKKTLVLNFTPKK
jgi:hypothetical protein